MNLSQNVSGVGGFFGYCNFGLLGILLNLFYCPTEESTSATEEDSKNPFLCHFLNHTPFVRKTTTEFIQDLYLTLLPIVEAYMMQYFAWQFLLHHTADSCCCLVVPIPIQSFLKPIPK